MLPAQSVSHRIAFVSSLGFGGSTTFLCNLGGELVRRQIPTLVVSPERENPMASDFEKNRVRVVVHDQRRMIFEDRMQSVLRTLADFQPTVVVACLGAATYEVLRYVPTGIYRMAVVQSDHAIFYEAISPFASCLDAAVGVSRQIVECFCGMRELNPVTKHYLPYGVPMPATEPLRDFSSHPLRVLYFGRLINPQKRVHLFPQILAALQSANMPFQWTIVGEGDQRETLERGMKTTLPHQQVIFQAAVHNSQVGELLDRHDVFLLASDAEGLPLSLLEAMGHGLVPVVSDLPSGIREVVDDTNGVRVPVEDVAGYARAIIHLHQHRDELAGKSVAARERVKKDFSVAAMADRWLAALPATPTTLAPWPKHFQIQAPLAMPRKFYFSPPVRILRRLALQWRNRNSS